jgi:glycosyltransferase involved in cell wall biosynthesis
MKVSVLMITYNHEKYIAQAISSVLMQNVNFDYELVVGEDCSTDNTRNIVTDFRDRYPDKVRLVTSDANVGGQKNAERTLNACQGEYIATLDGDDYWTSSDKLQKQVDFLESNPECSLAFHDAMVFYEDGQKEPHRYCAANLKKISTLEDLLVFDYIPSCSIMFRSKYFDGYPKWINEIINGDYLVNIIIARHGKIGYIEEVMGAYRVHRGGSWSGRSYIKQLQDYLNFYQKINEFLGHDYEAVIKRTTAKLWDDLSAEIIEQGVEQGVKEGTTTIVDEIISRFPKHITVSETLRAHIMQEVYARLVFTTFQAGDLSKARQFWWRLIRSDRSWLKNKGFLSIGVQSYRALLKERVRNLVKTNRGVA